MKHVFIINPKAGARDISEYLINTIKIYFRVVKKTIIFILLQEKMMLEILLKFIVLIIQMNINVFIVVVGTEH